MVASSSCGWIPRPTESAPCGSKSTSRTRRPNSASAAPRLMVVVVLPTPPFWLQTATTRAGPCLVSGSGWGKTGRGRPVGPVTSSATRDAATMCCTSQRGRTESLRWDPDSRAWGPQRQADSPFAGRIRAFRSLTAPVTGILEGRSERSGVRRGVHLAQLVHSDQGVDLGGGHRRVAEQFLHHPHVSPAVEQVGG